MKNMLRLLAALALCLLFAAPAMAAQEGYYTYEYSEEWGGAQITGYTGSATNVTMPSMIGGYDVVSISIWGTESFNSSTTLRLPDTIRYIEALPTTLKALYLPENVESVNYNAVGTLGNYPTYVDKDSATAKLLLTEPGEYPSMRFFDPDEPNYQIYYVRGENGEPELGLYKYRGAEEVVRIPDGFVHICLQAFTPDDYSQNTTTKKVYLPDSVTSVGQNAFTSLGAIEEIHLSPNITSFGEQIVTIVNSPKLFCDKDSVSAGYLTTDAYYFGFTDPEEPDWGFSGDGHGNLAVAKYHGSDEHVVVPDGVTAINNSAIQYNQSIKTITLPDSVTSLGDACIYLCDNLTDIYLPDGITSWGDYRCIDCNSYPVLHCSIDSETFRNMPYCQYGIGGICDPKDPDFAWLNDGNGRKILGKYLGSAQTVVIPDGTIAIHDYAFLENDTIVSLTIPESVTKLGTNSLFEMSALNEVYLPNNITEWGINNFCNSGDSYETLIQTRKFFVEVGSTTFNTIPGNVCYSGVFDERYPDYALKPADNGGLEIGRYVGSASNVVIPDIFTSIGSNAFAENHKVKTVVIPSSVTKIGEYAFYDMQKLTSVSIPDSVTHIGAHAFNRSFEAFHYPEKYQPLIVRIPDNLTYLGYGVTGTSLRTYISCTHGSPTSELIHASNNSDGQAGQVYIDPRWPDYLLSYYNDEVYFCGYIGTSNILTTPSICDVVATNASANTPNNLNLLAVNISEGVTRIEEEGCRFAAPTLNLPSTLRTIGKRAFSGANSLIIPEGVTYLPEETFEGYLERLVIPKSVTKIHKNAFTKNWYENGHEVYAIMTIFCYENSYADGWAQKRPYQDVEYITEGKYTLSLPGEFFAEMGEDFDWKSCVSVFPLPTIDYTLKITSYDKDVVEVKNGKLILKQPEIAKLKISSPELNASVTEFFTVFAALEDFNLPEYMFRKVGKGEITIKVSDVKPSKGTYPLYNWSRTPITEGFPGHGVTRDRYVTERFEDPSVHYLTATARNGLSRGGYLIFYDIIHDVKFPAFKDTYLVGDIVQPQISVSFDGTAYKNNRYTYTLTSSDPTVAKVTSKGKLQLLSKGTATITCEALDGTTVKRKITVQDINVYTIPKALQVISSEAFAGCPAQKIVIQDGCQAIGDKAFADCEMLETIVIPASVTGIAPNAFDGCPDGLVIEAPAGSYAASYAEEHGYTK